MSKIIKVIKAEALDDLRSELQTGVDLADQSASAAIAAKADAEAAQQAAETAAEIAMAAGWIYPNVAAGEAERVDGDYFWVVSADDSLILYKRTSVGSTKEFTYYSMSYFFSEEGSAW